MSLSADIWQFMKLLDCDIKIYQNHFISKHFEDDRIIHQLRSSSKVASEYWNRQILIFGANLCCFADIKGKYENEARLDCKVFDLGV